MRSLFVVGALVAMASIASASIDDFLGKKYELKERNDETLDELLKALGLGFITRKMFLSTKHPTISLAKSVKNPGYYIQSFTSSFKNHDVEFKLGEKLTDETMDGRLADITITFDGNKMTEVQKSIHDGKDLILTVVREFGPKQMKAVWKVNAVTLSEVYESQD